jgi:hypothetical protein
MGFYDAFFGSEQSQYSAYAIVAAIIAICITILLTATDIPVSNRILIVFFVIISLVPSVFLTLFELTCIVTGGTEPNQWWCYAFAWVLAAFIIIYCIFIVIISLISLFTYNNAIDNVTMEEQKGRLTPEVSNNYAKQIIDNDEKHTKHIEKFYADMGNPVLTDPLSYMMNKESNANSGQAALPSLSLDGTDEKSQNNQVSSFTNKNGGLNHQSYDDQISTFINQNGAAHFYGGSIPDSTDNTNENKPQQYESSQQSSQQSSQEQPRQYEPSQEAQRQYQHQQSSQQSPQKPPQQQSQQPPQPLPQQYQSQQPNQMPSPESSSTKEPKPILSSPNAQFTDINGQQELFNDGGYYPYDNLKLNN